MKTKLSVNINKVALIRNSRIGNYPDLYQFARDCEEFGADGITVHPRPDERHIRYSDIPRLKEENTTEFNIEGNPTKQFMKLVLDNHPTQCTLVPDSPDALTSDKGWNTIEHLEFLKDITAQLQEDDIRVSIFLNPIIEHVEAAKQIGADRIEFYTGDYAKEIGQDQELQRHIEAARVASQLGIGVNAGHDLSLKNLKKYKSNIPNLLEVSIGHALISDALYYGIKNAINMYKLLIR